MELEDFLEQMHTSFKDFELVDIRGDIDPNITIVCSRLATKQQNIRTISENVNDFNWLHARYAGNRYDDLPTPLQPMDKGERKRDYERYKDYFLTDVVTSIKPHTLTRGINQIDRSVFNKKVGSGEDDIDEGKLYVSQHGEPSLTDYALHILRRNDGKPKRKVDYGKAPPVDWVEYRKDLKEVGYDIWKAILYAAGIALMILFFIVMAKIS